mgnify:CR=1 FL=1
MLIKTTTKADVILTIVEEIDAEFESREKIYVYPYHNGKERGWHLTANNKAITFSENRNTDQIVVYHGAYTKFINGIPSNQIYEDKTFFANEDYVKVAKFYLKYLLSQN